MKKWLFLFFVILNFHIEAQEQKLTIAVLNLKNASDVSKGESDIISDRLRIELFKTGNVDVMEREQMQTVLAEQGFQQSGACSDEGCMAEMGKLLGVQHLITGSIGKLGTLYLLNLRAIDVKTGQISKVVSKDIRGGIEGVVKSIPDIAWNLTSDKKQVTAPPPEKPEPEKKEPEEKKPPKRKVDTKPPPKCDEIVFLESIDLSIISFKILDETFEDIENDIKDDIESALQEEVDDDIEVEIVTKPQIQQLPKSCKSGLVRMEFLSYSTSPSDDQIVGKAKACFYFFKTPFAQKPTFKISIEEEGRRHWGDQKPLINAMDEVSDEMEDQLADTDYIDILDPDKD